MRRAANREASEHFRKALAQHDLLPEDRRARPHRARDPLPARAGADEPARLARHGGGEVFERAGAVARRLELSADLAPPLIGMWLFHLARGQFDRAEGISGELFRIARGLDDPEILLQAHHAAWPTALPARPPRCRGRPYPCRAWRSTTSAGTSGTATSILGMIPLSAGSRSARSCSRSAARATTRSPWSGARSTSRAGCGTRRRWRTRSGSSARPRWRAATRPVPRRSPTSCWRCARSTGCRSPAPPR